MFKYYKAIVILSWLSLGILCILVYENNRIKKENKIAYYLTYALIAAAALAELIGIQLSGDPKVPALMLRIVKCLDYILTPMAGVALVWQMRIRNRWKTILNATIAANAVFQIISVFTGWMTSINEDNVYSHGPLYFVYMIFSAATITLVIIEFLIYGKSFKKQNRASLYSIMVLVLTGIIAQQMISSDIRTVYISLTLGSALMFIHNSEYFQLSTDEHVKQQENQLITDSMTGLYNRYAYSKALEHFSSSEALTEDFVVFSIDINGLKSTNDTLGHQAGDELICGAAECISDVFGALGRCYRTGGDEFIVISEGSKQQAQEMIGRIKSRTTKWRGKFSNELYLAVGFAHASDYPELSCEGLVKESDKAMYAAKAAWYRETGRERRRR